ncbi:cation transporting ATPase C-terminal domain-containing protein [Candidatus Phytoplasma australasiaticum]|uniref:cation transporting ATPase C-terminal domain-containing protein n=1 Tax=Candidatus Phytoplasma australasiaticum TaxID=2754999 RepID=UPI003B97D82D
MHDVDNAKYAQTFAFMVLAFSQLFHAWNFRSLSESIFSLRSFGPLKAVFIF